VKLQTKSVLLDIFVFIVALCIALMIVPLDDYLRYLEGRQFVRREYIFPISLALGACLALLFLARLMKWHREFTARRQLLLVFLAALAFISPFVFDVALVRPIRPTFTRGMLDRLEKDINPTDLRKWALAELSARANGRPDSDANTLIEKDLPNYLAKLSNWPPHIRANMLSDDVKEPHLVMEWGGGFGHWGLIVGGETLTVPEEPRFYFVKWKPGIYVFWLS
jgi:hypothetical protein